MEIQIQFLYFSACLRGFRMVPGDYFRQFKNFLLDGHSRAVPVQEGAVVLRYKLIFRVYRNVVLLFDFAGYFLAAFDIFEAVVPFSNSANRWLHPQYFLSQHQILFINGFTSLIFTKCAILANSGGIGLIISRVAACHSNPALIPIPDAEDVIHQILVVAQVIVLLHDGVVAMARGLRLWTAYLDGGRQTRRCSVCFDARLDIFEFVVVVSFGLQVHELLCASDG